MFSPDAPFKSLRVELFGVLDAPKCRGQVFLLDQLTIFSEFGGPDQGPHLAGSMSARPR